MTGFMLQGHIWSHAFRFLILRQKYSYLSLSVALIKSLEPHEIVHSSHKSASVCWNFVKVRG